MTRSKEVIEEFSSRLDSAKADLKCAMDAVTDGLPPADDKLGELHASLKSLRESYQELRNLALTVDSSLDPSAELPSSQYIEAIEAGELAKLRQEYEDAIEVLDTFLSIVADGRIYEDAIAPYKDSAHAALDELKKDEIPSLSVAIKEECRVKALFLTAVATKDLDTQEGNDLLDKIGDSFSLQVHRGLLLHKYSLPEADGREQASIAAQTPNPRVSPDEEDEAIQVDVIGQNGSTGQDDTPTDEHDQSDEGGCLDTGETKGAPQPQDRPICIRKSTRRVSASSFKRELTSSSPKATKVVLPLVAFFGALSRNQVEELAYLMTDGDCPKTVVPSAIEFLLKEGVVGEYELGDETIVAMTENGCSLVSKESIRLLKSGRSHYWALSIPADIEYVNPESSEGAFANRLHLADKFSLFAAAVRNKHREEGLGRTRHTFTIDEGTITVRVNWGSETFDCLLVDDDEIPNSPEDIVVIQRMEDSSVTLPTGFSGNAFIVCDGAISRCVLAHTDGETLVEGEAATNLEEITADPVGGDGSSDEPDANAEAFNMSGSARDDASDSPKTGDTDSGHPSGAGYHRDDASNGDIEAGVAPQILTSDNGPVDNCEERFVDESVSETKSVVSGSDLEAISDGIDGESSSSTIASALAKCETAPRDESFVKLATRLVSEIDLSNPAEADYRNIGLAVTLLNASSQVEGHKQSERLLQLIDLATGIGLRKLDRSGAGIATAFTGGENEYEALMLGALIRGMVAPKALQDYQLKGIGSEYLKNYEDIFPSYPEFKPLLNCLNNALSLFFESGPQEGFSDRVIRALDDRKASKKAVDEISREAQSLIDPPKFKAYVNGTSELARSCFGRGSDLCECMTIISQSNWGERELVESTLNSYLDNDTGEISDAAIDETIDRVWRQAKEKDASIRVPTLSYNNRDKAVEAFRSRLGVMRRWLELNLASAEGIKTEKLIGLRREIIAIIDELTQQDATRHHGALAAALYWGLLSVRSALTGSRISQSIFTDFLRTGLVSLDGEGFPLLPEKLVKYKYCEPWRDVLSHIASERIDLEEAAKRVFDPESPLFDNLGQLVHIGQALGSTAHRFSVSQEQVDAAEESAEADTSDFVASLEIDYTYNRINEAQEEDLLVLMQGCKEDFYALRDFGNWRRVLAGLRRQVDDYSAERGASLEDRIAKCRASMRRQSSSLLDEVVRLLQEDRNYAVAEEYLNRFEAGERELPKDRRKEPDDFTEFLSDEVFNPIFDLCNQCKGKPLPSFAAQFVKDRYPSGWSNRQKESSAALIKNWPVSNRRTSADSISALMREILGVQARRATEKYPGTRYQLSFVQADKDRANYPHPIAAFGTLAPSQINIIVLYGNQTPKDIIDRVAKENVVGMSIVLLNHPMRVATRRQLAEMFHTQQSRLNPFILIDQVLAIHMALHEQAERLPLLLKCALPFTYYQPFVRGSGPTANEMFCGRDDELRKILDPKGASVVYGGRQLGKTALLTRAQSLANHPDNKEYAVFVTILSCHDEKSVANVISEEFEKQGVPSIGMQDDLKSLCDRIQAQMLGGSISRMLLLIDECDNFLESISKDSYLAIQPLVDLKRSTSNAFKFVIAGLHNVCRAKNASEHNGIIPQLGDPLCIKPLQPNDALQLITKPLLYLGFHIDRYPYLITILTNTNYYPGIIQFFGYELIESMTKQYGDYYRAVDGNPPYTLQEIQLGAIMASADLNKSIKEKFRWSLELDERYFMIARCVAMLYYDYADSGNLPAVQDGFTVGDIKENAESWGIKCLAAETPQTYTNLLDEMVDMGILSKPDINKNRYRLRRYSFLNIIGPTQDSVFEDIIEHNE